MRRENNITLFDYIVYSQVTQARKQTIQFFLLASKSVIQCEQVFEI